MLSDSELRSVARNARTAGVVLRYRDRFVFQTGFNRARDALGVVRLGGHREPGESVTECASREVEEEASVRCEIESAPSTWLYSSEDPRPVAVQTEWSNGPPSPLMIGCLNDEDGQRQFGVTYLAKSADRPSPASETQALLYLRAGDVRAIVEEELTLGDYLRNGGEAELASELPRDLVLRPHQQIVVLNRLISTSTI